MISRLALKNFRAFEFCDLTLSKINIFIGPNNSGKSSILSAVNAIAQSVNEMRAGTPLVLRGRYQDLGTYIDVVHRNVPRTVMGFELDIDAFTFKVQFKYRTLKKGIEVKRYEIMQNDKQMFLYSTSGEKYDVRYYGKSAEDLIPGLAKRRPQFTGLVVSDPNIRSFSVQRYEDKFKNVSEKDVRTLHRASRGLMRSRVALVRAFASFDSLSPFRQPPERTFLFSGETPTEVGKDGAKAIDMLVADSFARGAMSHRVLDGVCEWFKATGMAESLAVKPLTSRHFEIVLCSEDGEHNICDVGFGCSQVLPVLVGGLNLFLDSDAGGPDEPIFLVQEPEIHLHPNAQAELGTFFAELCKGSGQLFLETHSDNMILRIRRHVAEGVIDPEDVKIFFVQSRSSGEKTITEMKINGEGVFERQMPGGFFPQRQYESLELAKAAAKARRKSSEK